ncbi:rhomboid family intramembrane serine protease [Natranaerobius thermophilus]|uniref:Rhomboid family protein n=1 Tax=Natranaerobius thermophilus (strain ATCC BAA-1301 / DSM 18059 / JW/NM-WN-LF) TaxID=457570 RepID=B2A427_NATTJ|nr:rhomboid family intramembrane serine protease [Natranaerobius thermophilus]ACB85129.1 Rhomboid family protein [Natranaerobius thermophilus JW/NM-WN-LF]
MNDITNKYKAVVRDRHGTLVIIFVNLLFYIVLNTIPNLGDKLLLYPEINMVIERPWTLITVFFSHEIHIHILGNMGLFFFFGSKLEKVTNSKVVILVYLITGFIGSLAILPVAYLIEWTETVVGASAAVFGIVSAFAVLRPSTIILRSKAKWWALALFVFNAIIAIINPQISVGAGAHAVGIIVGLIIGYWLKNKKTNLN